MKIKPMYIEFFDKLRIQAQCINTAIQLIREGIRSGEPRMSVCTEEVCALESQGNLVLRDVIRDLERKIELVSVNAEEFYQVFCHMDNILHCVAHLAVRVPSVRAMASSSAINRLAEIMEECSGSLLTIVDIVGKSARPTEHVLGMYALRDEAHHQYHEAIRDLYASELDAIQWVKLRELYESLREIIDSFGQAVQSIENVILKHKKRWVGSLRFKNDYVKRAPYNEP